MTLRGSIAVPVSLVQRLPRLVTGTSDFGGGDWAACCGCTMPHRHPWDERGHVSAWKPANVRGVRSFSHLSSWMHSTSTF